MTVALWCVLVAGLLFVPFEVAAKWSRKFDNAKPRAYQEQLSGWRLRAHWTQQNSFEAFPLFAAAVIICHLVAGASATADALALAFVGLRIVYGLCYLADRATLRSIVWLCAQACVIALFVVAARA